MPRQLAALAAALLSAIIVVDGDTVKMDGTTYRLLGFDTPETFYARCASERRLGDAATARLKELIGTSEAELETTNRNCKWERKCARLLINGRDVAEIMIQEGHAVPYNGRGPRKDWCT